MKNIKSIMDAHFSHLTIDAKFLNAIHQYGVTWLNRSEDHIHFFGGNLLGVYPIRYTSSDRNEFLDVLLGIDESVVRKEIVSLPHIDDEWKRATDMVNISCVYLVHRIMNSSLSTSQKEKGMTDVLTILHYKLFSSLMAHFFRYPADEKTATATYAALSKKYAIKQKGTWGGVMEQRAHDIFSSSSIHYQTIKKFNDDAAIVYMITDIQGRLRNMVKNIWVVFDEIRTSDAKILTTGGTIELDGKIVVRDVSRLLSDYSRYLNEIILDKNRFIKDELIQVISSAQYTMPQELLIQALTFISDNHSKQNVRKFLDEVLLHAFEFVTQDKVGKESMSDLSILLSRLRALYMASRSSHPALLIIRDLGSQILKKSVNTRSESTLASVRTGTCLYIVLRIFTKNYYK